MAFTNTKGRYASFGIVTSLPSSVIDSFWYFIDSYLKDVIPLQAVLTFHLKNNHGQLQLVFSQLHYQQAIRVDVSIPFDPFFPSTVLVVDKSGSETIALPDEITFL